MVNRTRAGRFAAALATLLLATALRPELALAHDVTRGDAAFLANNVGPAVGPFLYLGAKHMVTGYDHILFLVGVLFFLYRMRDVALYVSLFTLGHSLTLLAGVLGGIRADAYVVDAIIGLSIVYKAFDNMGGFQRILGRQPDTRLAVLGFGLVHGFGLATKVQEYAPSSEGLVTNIVSFNVGVEIGQVLALMFVLIGLNAWRARGDFAKHAFAANAALMTGGFLLTGYQIAGYFVNGS
jgi:hypothetical protein